MVWLWEAAAGSQQKVPQPGPRDRGRYRSGASSVCELERFDVRRDDGELGNKERTEGIGWEGGRK